MDNDLKFIHDREDFYVVMKPYSGTYKHIGHITNKKFTPNHRVVSQKTLNKIQDFIDNEL